MSVKITTNQNTVTVADADKSITIVNNNQPSKIDIVQPISNTIIVTALGPQGAQGAQGPQGIPGTGGDNSGLVATSSFNTFTSSIQTQVNSLINATSSYVVSSQTSSFVLNQSTGSMLQPYVLTSITSSMIVSGALTASFLPVNTYQITASWAQSASQALTASYVNPLTQNVIITGSLLVTQSHISTVDYIDFKSNLPAGTPTFSTGRLHWVDDTKTLGLDTDVNGSVVELGHQQVVRVVNLGNSTITRGSVVYMTGSSGTRPGIATASYTDENDSATTLGFVMHDIVSTGGNSNGYVVVKGLLRDVNTFGFQAGQSLYISSSGQYSTSKPQAPLHDVRLGKVVVGNSTNAGVIYVDIQNGYELDELHNVRIISDTSGDLLIKSGSLWINSKQLTGSYRLTGSLSFINGGVTGSLFGTSSWAQSASRALTASYVANMPTPGGGTYEIQYNNGGGGFAGDAKLTFNGSSFVVRNNNDTADAFSTAVSTRYIYTQLPQHRRLDTALQDDIIDDKIKTGDLIGASLSRTADWDLVYLDTDGNWKPIDQGSNTKATQMLGITDGERVFIEGYLTVGDYASAGGVPLVSGSLVAGKPVYIAQGATSAPFLSTIVPTSGIVRILGHLIRNSNTDYWLMKFRPDHTWVEI